MVQEAFLSMWRSGARYDRARGSVRTWVLGIVHHRGIDALRRSLVHERRRASDEGIEERFESGERTDVEVVRRDEAAEIRTMLEELPTEQQKVIEPGGKATLAIGHEGTTLRVSEMPSPPADRIYQVWLKRDRSAPDPTNAMFTVDRNGSGTVAVPGKLDDVDQVLVTAEPRGGSVVPTRAPVVIADVSSA